jgi:1-phosphofructokinase family hexose kinase
MSASEPRRPGLRVTACLRRIEDDLFLCVSLNPAIDKRVRLQRLHQGHVNRAMEVTQAPGGKAAHVAMVLRTLGADPLWMGFAGGPTGVALDEGLKSLSIRVKAVQTASATRTNLEILENEGTVTEILEPGEAISAEERESLQAVYEAALRKSSGKTTVILSGSLPPGVPEDYYATLIELGHQCGCRVFVDTSGEPLKLALKAHPDFVKPNQEEAEWLSGCLIDGPRSAANALKMIIREGASAGAISLGPSGLLCQRAKEGEVLFARVPEMMVRSTVGSGDSTLAGFAFAGQQGLEPAETLRLAAACGAANCLADGPGCARADDITRLKKEIHVDIVQELTKG